MIVEPSLDIFLGIGRGDYKENDNEDEDSFDPR